MDGRIGITETIFAASMLLTAACDEASTELDLIEISERSALEPSSVVASMGLGDGESWVVMESGELKGWGQRYCDASGCLEPLEIDPIDLGGVAIQVRSNGHTTAALRADGTVLSFGPTLTDAGAPSPVIFEDSVAELAIGADFMCARLDDGHVQCRALEGLTAPGWLTGFQPIADAVELVAGAEHACARLKNDDIVCWGSNDAGQLGSANATGTSTITLSGPVAQLEAGGEHTCARLEGGQVQCWGSNGQGQLGHAGPGAGLVPLTESAAEIAAGAEHTCAIGAATGSLYCWGSNALGQLGAGEDSSDGIRAVDLGGLRATAIFADATAWTTFAVLEGAGVRGWGANDSGQAGYGDSFAVPETTQNIGELPDIPIFVPPLEP